MLLSLYVLRHAKAEAEAPPHGGDAERDLKHRGRRDARNMGRFLSRLDEEPQLILTSSAVRALETARLACEGWKATLESRPEIYAASPAALFGVLNRLETAPARVLLVGHQPGLGLFIAELTGSEPEFPTAALARIDLEVARWGAVAPGCGRLVWLVTPAVVAARRRSK